MKIINKFENICMNKYCFRTNFGIELTLLKIHLNQRYPTGICGPLVIPKPHLEWSTIKILFYINHCIGYFISKALKEIRGNEGRETELSWKPLI